MLTIKNITKKFGKKTALNKLSFEIPQGIALGIVGPNGAGKTTLFHIISGINNANEGEVLWDNSSIQQDGRVPRSVGYALQRFGLHKNKLLIDELNYLIELSGLEIKSYAKELELFLQKSKLTEYKRKKIRVLSQGNLQKLNLFQAQLNNPKILLYDEPFVSLDVEQKNYIKKEIQQQKKNGSTILISSHNLGDVMDLCDSFIFIDSGELIEHVNKEIMIKNFFTITVPAAKEENSAKIAEMLHAMQDISFAQHNRYDDAGIFVLYIKELKSKQHLESRLAQLNFRLAEKVPLEEIYFYFIKD